MFGVEGLQTIGSISADEFRFMRINVGCSADLGMTKTFLYLLQISAALTQQHSGCMAQIM
ncbi:hypothetical protein ASG81_24690 [Paenibacillus sp. Soil522]|nr:hypothetical protein [Paenibacillus sp. Soil522]KRE32233.1 hypothetical protein ASG81_24690 [Paenibacillus sp. Soil522]